MVLFAASEDDSYFAKLKEILNAAKNDQELFETIVNAPFSDRRRSTLLDLGMVVLLLVNKKTRAIERIVASDTDFAKSAVRMSSIELKDITTPISYKGNFIAEAIRSERYQQTSNWQYLFAPAIPPEEAKLAQSAAGIACSFVYPLVYARDGGALVFHYYQPINKIEREHHDFMRTYSKLVTNRLRS